MRKLPWIVCSAALLSGCGSDIAAPRILLDSGTSEACAVNYPAGPYGSDVGSVVEDHAFIGRKNGIPTPDPGYDTITLADLYAMRLAGKKYLVFNVAAFWCSPCKEEAKELAANVVPKYGPKGVVFLSVVLENGTRGSATPKDIDTWIKTYKLDFAAVADPDYYVSRFFMKDSMPLNMIIDLSTMKIVSKTIGANLPQVEAKLDSLLGG